MPDRLDDLMAAHLAGTLDEAGGAELLAALDADPSLAARLAGQLAMHRWLEASAAGPVPAAAILEALPGKDVIAERGQRRFAERPSHRRRWLLAALIAALLAGFCVWWMAKGSTHPQRGRPAPSHGTPAAPAPGAEQRERTIDLRPIADGDVDETDKTRSSGHQPTLRVRGGEPGREHVSLLRFAIPAGHPLRGQLILRRIEGDAVVSVRVQDGVGAWTEDDLRFWHLPQRGRTLGRLVGKGDEWSIELIDPGWSGQMEFMLDAASGAVVFGSREDAAHAPILRLTLDPAAAPVPATTATGNDF